MNGATKWKFNFKKSGLGLDFPKSIQFLDKKVIGQTLSTYR